MTQHSHAPRRLSPERRARLERSVRVVAASVVLYNLIEAVVAIWAGVAAGSISLIGFGLDSVVEMASALIVLWQFRSPLPEDRERAALRGIAIAFFALAGYVVIESALRLLSGAPMQPAPWGIAITALSLVVMPVLSLTQRRFGRELGSHAVVADSKQTLLCTYLSAGVLLGLLVHALTGWSWVDPVIGLAIAGLAVREGVEAWRGESCHCLPEG